MKTIFEKSIEEIKQDQKSLSGSFETDPSLAKNVFNICRHIEKLDKKDDYLRDLKEPLAILFIYIMTNTHGMIILGLEGKYSFWCQRDDMPMPIASTFEGTFWNPELYGKKTPISLPHEEIAPIIYRYPVGHFK